MNTSEYIIARLPKKSTLTPVQLPEVNLILVVVYPL